MTITPRIYEFPNIKISKQLFSVPGAVVDGGYTRGGARVSSPEPGGYSMLEIQPAMQVAEFVYPIASWLMSKTNGEILRIRLAPTPQVAGALALRSGGVPWGAQGFYPDVQWSNQQNWAGDTIAGFTAVALEGTNVVKIDMTAQGPILQAGHVFGHGNVSYLVDEISYDNAGIATVVTKPPLRSTIGINEIALLRPYFLGQIKASDFRTTYDADQNGNIQLGMITLSEVIV
jgi:hypothetical protein